MKLDIHKDRGELNKIIKNLLPLMKMNKNLTWDCADCILLYFIEKEEKEIIKSNKDSQKGNTKSSGGKK